MTNEQEMLEVTGARVHNLKNVDVLIPRNQLVVFTGLSGSGKSSLAFDTIYAEGQRRYIETFGTFARQFLGSMERPDVDHISGLSPVIAIEQKTVNKNPRSTVGTITEVYDFLRLLFARTSDAFSYVTGKKMVRYSEIQITDHILNHYTGQKIILLAPVVKGRKGHYRELFEQIRKQGFLRARIDGELVELGPRMQVDRYKVHDIEIVIDRTEVQAGLRARIAQSIELALKNGKGNLMVLPFTGDGIKAKDLAEPQHFSKHLMCPESGISYSDPEPNLFSFNSPYGACPQCNGLGTISKVDINKIIPNKKLSIRNGGILPLGDFKRGAIYDQLEMIGDKYEFTLDTPLGEISEDALQVILFGSEEIFRSSGDAVGGHQQFNMAFEGIANFLMRQQDDESFSPTMDKWLQSFMNQITCPTCAGARLKKESLYFKVGQKNIAELSGLSIKALYDWTTTIEEKLNAKTKVIAHEILKEIKDRLSFLLEVGLEYLSLDRPARSLSGGEAQRIRLATQIGSQLVGVLYILDEPSIGLHQRDNTRLINALKKMRDLGNSVLVVEHDKDMILAADYVFDIGPRAGIHGGEIVAAGKPKDFLKKGSLTAQYLNGKKEIRIPESRRLGNGKRIELKGATGHNLKKVNLNLPLGTFICITGVSGSGKSSLINETLYPILNNHYYHGHRPVLPYKSITGLEHIDKVIGIDQSPIGRTPRSNPATYTNVFSEIRTLFAATQESKIRGYKPGRFSFNVKGGRCETCQGAGLRTIEMNFLPDVYVHCETCNGKRYNRETLEVRYKGKSIADVLNMTIDQAVEFFEPIPAIFQKIKTLKEVGLGYITLGQQSTTLSGGEAQRVKLATELSKKDTGNTFYILDEPTTGLHFEDITILLDVLGKLVNHGNTVLVIEHNMDIIKVADHLIDLGPEGGESGGRILFEGTPEEMIKNCTSPTAEYLKKEFVHLKKNKL